MNQTKRELSNLSYTNKDFGQIYPELLDLAKKLSYKWDPSVSDESDPGVVLLKLAALMADKNNYNIDKNILELFPLSVSQTANARQIFEQSGYYMKHYHSGETDYLKFIMQEEPELTVEDLAALYPVDTPELDELDSNDMYIRKYVIPKYTMVTDADSSVVYTTLADATVESDGASSVTVHAIQGIINTYAINGNTVITSTNLDYKNRLYFTDLDIPENGIFIENNLCSEWTRVDNLLLEKTSSFVYKFGLTQSGSKCFIEFPEDIDELIGEGLTIRYVKTLGRNGNIKANLINSFYTDVTGYRYIDSLWEPQECKLTNDNIIIRNVVNITDGADPETIDEAYRNYEKIKTTFNTLISCKDYENFLYTNKDVSNSVVCDRLNDIQSTYQVFDASSNQSKTIIQTDESSNPELTAFDLRVYGLKYSNDFTRAAGFNKSFELIDKSSGVEDDWGVILQDTEKIKSISHNFADFEDDRILLIFNQYPITAKIVPQYKLTTAQQVEVLKAIRSELFATLNSRQLDFGDSVEYDVIYDTIMNADTRIKSVVLDDIVYTSWAVYRHTDSTQVDQRKFCYIRVDDKSSEPTDEFEKTLWNKFRHEIYAKNVLAGKTQLFTPENTYNVSLSHNNSSLHDKITSITTDAFIVATSDDYGKTFRTTQLQKNENLLFTAPKLEPGRKTFSNYIKYIHNIGLTEGRKPYGSPKTIVVPANADYTLKDNEFIVFFWKTEDDEDAPYIYQKYTGKGEYNIITPSFSIYSQNDPRATVLPPLDILDEVIVRDLKTVENTLHTSSTDGLELTVTDSNTTMSLTDYVGELAGSDYVLTGTRQIVPKRVQITTLANYSQNKSTRSYPFMYWILNTKTADNKYVLPLSELKDGAREYTLQHGEQLIYTNPTQTDGVILDEGCTIRLTGGFAELDGWSCEGADLDEYAENSVLYLNQNKLWFELPAPAASGSVQIIVSEFEQLSEGYVVTFSKQGSVDQSNEQLKNQNLVISRAGVYKNVNLEPLDNPETIPAQFWSTLGTSSNSAELAADNLLAEYKITYLDKESVDVSLTYKDRGDSCWHVKSLLNLDFTNSSSQSISNHQLLTCYENDNNIASISDKRILGDHSITRTGGERVDVTTLNILTDRYEPLQVYDFEIQADATTDSKISYKYTETTTEVKIPERKAEVDAETTTIELPFRVPVGKYVIPFDITVGHSQDEYSISFKRKDNSVVELLFEDHIQYKNTHCLIVDLISSPEEISTQERVEDATEEFKAVIVTKQAVGSSGISILFKPPYRWSSDLEATTLNQVVKEVSELDKNNIFDYTHVVDTDTQIINPLSSSSFLDANHVYNKFTICKWDCGDDKMQDYEAASKTIQIINKVK